MSISTLQEKIFNKGCGTAVMVLMAVAMVATMFSQCGKADDLSGRLGGDGNAVAFVGNLPVSGELIQSVASQQAQQSPNQGALAQATSLASATNEALQLAALQTVVAEEPPLTEAEIEKAAAAQVDGMRAQLERFGMVKPGASDAEFEKAFKTISGGKTLAEARKTAIENAKKAFADPQTKERAILQYAPAVLTARYGEKLAGDEAALRESFRGYVVKRLFFSAQSGSTETPEARAKKAEEALKAGTSFDKLMDTVSNDPAPAGKPAHEADMTVPGDLIATRPFAELKGKAAGATTGILDVEGGKAIYRLVRIEENVPADFSKNIAKYRSMRAATAGGPELKRKLDAALASDKVRWENPGFQALYGAWQASTDPTKLPKAVELGKKAVASENSSIKRLGALALLAATQGTTGNDRLVALETALSSGIEDADLSLQLARLHAEKKDGVKTTADLLAASKTNLNYDATGQRLFGDINAEALKQQKAGVITAAQLTEIQTQQAVWSKAREENEKLQAETKKQDEAVQKANEAEIARQKAEAAKNAPKPDAKPGATTPDVKVTLPPTTTGTAGNPGIVPPAGPSATTGGTGR